MSSGGSRIDFDTAASGSAQANFNKVASQLEALIAQRDGDVKAALSDYQADGVSEEYQAKEARWNRVAGEVRGIIAQLRQALVESDQTASDAVSKAKNAVASIG